MSVENRAQYLIIIILLIFSFSINKWMKLIFPFDKINMQYKNKNIEWRKLEFKVKLKWGEMEENVSWVKVTQ